jgi:hypothetical protein
MSQAAKFAPYRPINAGLPANLMIAASIRSAYVCQIEQILDLSELGMISKIDAARRVTSMIDQLLDHLLVD